MTPLWRNRDFVLLQAGQMLSTLGSSASQLAYPLLILATTHSPAKAGAVGFANLVPYAVFGLVAGVAADRWNRKRLMVAMEVVRALAMTSIVVAIAGGVLTFAQVVAAAFVEGTAFVLFNVAEVGAIRSVVPKRQLPDAFAAEQARFSVVTLTGPPFAGALFGLGRSLPFLADAISYVFSIVSLLGMRTPFQEERERDPASLRVQIREGFSFLWQQPFLRTCALIFAGDNFVFQGLYLTLVVVARRHGLSSAAIGAMIAVFGAVQLVGALLAPRMAKRLTMRTLVLLGQWVVAAAIAFLVVRSPYVLLATALPMALVGPWTNAAIIGYRTAVTPDRLVGRVSSVARNIALLAQPLGPLAAGLLISAWSPWTATLVLVAIGTALAVWASVSPSIRQAPSLDELDADTALA